MTSLHLLGTPDSSRIWDGAAYREGNVVEKSKEEFRKNLQKHFPDPDILLNKERMAERTALATDNALPDSFMLELSRTYIGIAEKVIGKPLVVPAEPRAEILAVLKDELKLVD